MIPRALVGQVMAMARPRRPAAEAATVRVAAAVIQSETGLNSARALGREIAERVTSAILDDARNDPSAILPCIANGDPFSMLAFTQDDAAVDELAVRFRDKMLVLFGAYIPPTFQQEVQRRAAAYELCKILANRYAKKLVT